MLDKYIWTNSDGVRVVLYGDLETYIFTPFEFKKFREYMIGKDCTIFGNEIGYKPEDVVAFLDIIETED